ncbi:MAG: YHS domain-containing protein [candidate division NC10 bacterium]|nr:YHS domain-containing protein [candidate division NC10 bacterium]
MAKDPVCGMEVDEKKTPVSIKHKEKTYYFCSPGCQETFTKSPAKFTSEKAASRHDY